jgi:hypothetical protein
MVFGVILKDLKHKIEFYEDLPRLPKFDLNDGFLFIGENKGMVDRILKNDVMNAFKSCQKSLKLLYVSSEIQVVSNSNLLIKATFEYCEDEIEKQINFVMNVVSRVLQIIS